MKNLQSFTQTTHRLGHITACIYMYIYLHAFQTLEHLEKFRLFPKTNGFYD